MSTPAPETGTAPSAPPPTPPPQGQPGQMVGMRGGMAWLPVILSVVALVLAGSALGLSLTSSGSTGPAGPAGAAGATGTQGPTGPQGATGGLGPAGPAGATGARGAPGPQAVINSSTVSVEQYFSTTCGNPPGAVQSIEASGPGVVVVTASVHLELVHSFDNFTADELFLSNASASCTGIGYDAAAVTAELPTESYYTDATLVGSFDVNAAGTQTFYVNGYDVSTGSDRSAMMWASFTAVYYPA